MLGLLLGATTLPAQYIDWRVSVKVILDANGQRPPAGNFSTDDEIRGMIAEGNHQMTNIGRGYRYTLTEIVLVAGISQWFDADRTNVNAIEAAAELDPDTYKYRTNAINIYINNWGGTAVCSFPHDADNANDLIFIGQGSFLTSFMHESGHYFDLLHSFTGEAFQNANNTTCTNANYCASCSLKIGGDGDLIPDTIADNECWSSAAEILAGNPGADNAAVQLLFHNIMSYRGDQRTSVTEDQLDRMTDTANSIRLKVTSGKTRYVSLDGSIFYTGLRSNQPKRTVQAGVTASAAAGGDIVLMRPGSFNEQFTINKPVTLRATRAGAVTIGQ